MVVNAHTNTHAKDAERGTPVAVLTKGREREREGNGSGGGVGVKVAW